MSAVAAPARPRLGFLGTGWIGRDRLRAVAHSAVAEVAVLADPADRTLREAAADAPGATLAHGLDELLDA
ncbi:MAG: hypothetical protein QOG56_485, partial [Solirubrobacteraceae bacterium]|nr:hypothetical protein [Solirubrobacteraceae bacterium]